MKATLIKNITTLAVLACIFTLSSCSKDSSSSPNLAAKGTITVNFRGKTYTITSTNYPLLYANTISFPVDNSTGGKETISRIDFHGESKEIAVGATGFKRGSIVGNYTYESVLGPYNYYWKLGSFYRKGTEIPLFENSTSVPTVNEVMFVDFTAGGVAYISIPANCSITVTASDNTKVAGTFNLQVSNGTSKETVSGSFVYNK